MKANTRENGELKVDKSCLSDRDVLILVGICTEFVNFCATVTGRIDPAAAAMLAYVRDDILESRLNLPRS